MSLQDKEGVASLSSSQMGFLQHACIWQGRERERKDYLAVESEVQNTHLMSLSLKKTTEKKGNESTLVSEQSNLRGFNGLPRDLESRSLICLSASWLWEKEMTSRKDRGEEISLMLNLHSSRLHCFLGWKAIIWGERERLRTEVK